MIASIGGSSSLSQVSMAEMRQRMFSKIDTNSDGKHDKDELAQMVAQGPQGGPSVNDILSKFDTDGDGSISESEFSAGPEKGQQAQSKPATPRTSSWRPSWKPWRRKNRLLQELETMDRRAATQRLPSLRCSALH